MPDGQHIQASMSQTKPNCAKGGFNDDQITNTCPPSGESRVKYFPTRHRQVYDL